MPILYRLLGAASMLATLVAAAEPARITVHADQPGVRVSPLLYGHFFEEINRAGDGGLYAELVRNRSFEDATQPEAWSLVTGGAAAGRVELDRSRPLNSNNVTALRLDIATLPTGTRVGVANAGFHGIAVEKGELYSLTLAARGDAVFRGDLRITLERTNGAVLAAETIRGIGPEWSRRSCALAADDTDPAARLVVSATSTGTVWLDMVSLFPSVTYKGHGLRKDLMQMLAAMKPAFIRFPGGCYVEGDQMANAFRWKKTLGDPAERPGHWNLWGYRSTDGLGFHEYLQMCEDLDAAPLFVINCGMAHKDHVPMEQMQEYVQDALDAIEYANGGTDTPWGALRARRGGHPAPFNLKLLEIGNENGGPLYHERYALFHDAIKAKYPDVRLIANVWNGVPTSRPVEIVDEHYYNTPGFFMGQARRYDTYDRTSPKVYVGEYACTKECGEGNLMAAIGEAAFMTGLERNGDHVVMASYAPLFCHPGWKRWNPNAIVFNAARAYGTPSFHVQALFGANRGDVNLPVEIVAPVIAQPARGGRIGVGTWRTQAEFKDIRVEREGQALPVPALQTDLAGWDIMGGTWNVVDGALQQSGDGEPAMAFTGDRGWTDYTLSLKARKLGGAEGFLVQFHSQHNQEKSWWNIGGWGNASHGLEAPGLHAPHVGGRIETGRWYDIRVELKGGQVRCYLDGTLVQEAARTAPPALFAVAGRDERAKELVLKVVNASGAELASTVELKGAGPRAADGRGWVLTAASPDDENTFEEPAKVRPQPVRVTLSGATLAHAFPAYSVTVLRIPVK